MDNIAQMLERIDRIEAAFLAVIKEKEEMKAALIANKVFHTPLAFSRRCAKWNKAEMDAIRKTRKCLAGS